VATKVDDTILPDLYYVTDDPETVPFDEFPDEYVIKSSHSCGQVILVDEGTDLDFNSTKQLCQEWLDSTYGQMAEEYWYSNIDPKILVEEYINPGKYTAPIDYKFAVFHGEVKFILVSFNRFAEEGTKRNVYDKYWNFINVKKNYEQGQPLANRPDRDKMVEIAEKVGEDFDHIRVDLYNPNKKSIYFGEFAVADAAGFSPFVPEKYDFEFGSFWHVDSV
jgi:hypothetical protein